MSDVTAVVFGATGRPPAGAGVASVAEVPSLDALARAAREAATALLWLLDANAQPSAETLPALLEHAEAPAASLPVDERGEPVEPLLGRFTESDVPGILSAVANRCVPLRHTYLISLLVERDLVTELAPPDPQRFGRYAGSEWTARLFARRRGMLVPASRVRIGALAARAPGPALRMAQTGVWRRGETLRELQRALLRAA
jgi:hypothetical protein